MPKTIVFFSLFILLLGCTETRVKRYGDIVEPHIGTGKKDTMGKLLGAPTFCRQESKYEMCEYRTSRGRNEQVPFVHKKAPAMGPDLAPYEHFDVVRLYFDGFSILRDWEPVVLPER